MVIVYYESLFWKYYGCRTIAVNQESRPNATVLIQTSVPENLS